MVKKIKFGTLIMRFKIHIKIKFKIKIYLIFIENSQNLIFLEIVFVLDAGGVLNQKRLLPLSVQSSFFSFQLH